MCDMWIAWIDPLIAHTAECERTNHKCSTWYGLLTVMVVDEKKCIIWFTPKILSDSSTLVFNIQCSIKWRWLQPPSISFNKVWLFEHAMHFWLDLHCSSCRIKNILHAQMNRHWQTHGNGVKLGKLHGVVYTEHNAQQYCHSIWNVNEKRQLFSSPWQHLTEYYPSFCKLPYTCLSIVTL